MWETIQETSKSIPTLVFVLLIVIIAVLLIKGNYLKIRTSHVKVGTDEQERTILREQIEWTYQYVQGLYGVIMEKYPDLDRIKTRLVLERVYDEIINWISFNHISLSDTYYTVKCEKLQGVVLQMNVSECIRSDEFKQQMNKWARIIITRLVEIRKYYNDTH